MEDAVKSVTRKLSGESGPGGKESEALHGYILKSVEDIKILRTSMETFIDWIFNESPLWTTCRAYISGRLIALEKQPDMRMVGVGETWRHLFDKIVLKVKGPEDKMLCQYEHMCAGINAGIYGVVHGVQDIWNENLTIEDWVFLLVYANNTLNKINRIEMLWKVCHFMAVHSSLCI